MTRAESAVNVAVALVRKPAATGGDFVLDRTENPHPRMLELAIGLRRLAREQGGVEYVMLWTGYLLAMESATGETADALNAWIDRQR